MEEHPQDDYIIIQMFAYFMFFVGGFFLAVSLVKPCPSIDAETSQRPAVYAPDWHETETNENKREWLEALPEPIENHRFKN